MVSLSVQDKCDVLYLIMIILGQIRHAEFLKGKLGCPDERGRFGATAGQDFEEF